MTVTRTILCFGDSNTWGADPQNRGVRFPADDEKVLPFLQTKYTQRIQEIFKISGAHAH